MKKIKGNPRNYFRDSSDILNAKIIRRAKEKAQKNKEWIKKRMNVNINEQVDNIAKTLLKAVDWQIHPYVGGSDICDVCLKTHKGSKLTLITWCDTKGVKEFRKNPKLGYTIFLGPTCLSRVKVVLENVLKS